MSLWFIPLAAILKLSSCCVDNNGLIDDASDNRRVGGVGSGMVSYGEAPFVVVLRFAFPGDQPNYLYTCSGSIIHEKVSLTAGHCVVRRDPAKNVRQYISLRTSYIIVGAESITDETSPQVRLVEAIVPPEFDYRWIGDLGLLRTAESMVGPGIPGRVIPLACEDPRRSLKVKVVGYGRNSVIDKNSTMAFRSGEMCTSEIFLCKDIMKETWDPNDARYLCLTSFYTQILKGDSGGPTIYMGKLIGVLKGGRTPTPSDYENFPEGFWHYAVAESVPYSKEWIVSHLPREELEPSVCKDSQPIND